MFRKSPDSAVYSAKSAIPIFPFWYINKILIVSPAWWKRPISFRQFPDFTNAIRLSSDSNRAVNDSDAQDLGAIGA